MSNYTPVYLSKNVYRYLMYLQLYNHCMSKRCLDCVFDFEWSDINKHRHCYLVHTDWDSIKRGPGSFITEEEAPIFKILCLTDGPDGLGCTSICNKCRFGVLSKTDGYYYSCAPFIDPRHLCFEIIKYKGDEH